MTPAQLKSAVLAHLQVTPAGGADAADDVAVLTEKYAGLHQMLLTKSLVKWAIGEDIPEEAELPMVAMLSAFAANEFHIPDPRYTRLQLEGGLDLQPPSLAERQLRKVISENFIFSPLRTEYF